MTRSKAPRGWNSFSIWLVPWAYSQRNQTTYTTGVHDQFFHLGATPCLPKY